MPELVQILPAKTINTGIVLRYMANNPRKTIKYIFLIVVSFLIGFAVIDSVGVFNKKDYVVVPHGNHNHYVPNDRDPNIPVHSFPQRPPNPGEKLTPQGQIVRVP